MGLDELLAAIGSAKTIQDHPDWAQFRTRKMPKVIRFYYTNQDGQEAYWDQARILKFDLKKMLLVVEGVHRDPLKFDLFKIMHCKDANTGESVQEVFFELTRMWTEVHHPSE